jgi:hypothetical protein
MVYFSARLFSVFKAEPHAPHEPPVQMQILLPQQ